MPVVSCEPSPTPDSSSCSSPTTPSPKVMSLLVERQIRAEREHFLRCTKRTSAVMGLKARRCPPLVTTHKAWEPAVMAVTAVLEAGSCALLRIELERELERADGRVERRRGKKGWGREHSREREERHYKWQYSNLHC